MRHIDPPENKHSRFGWMFPNKDSDLNAPMKLEDDLKGEADMVIACC